MPRVANLWERYISKIKSYSKMKGEDKERIDKRRMLRQNSQKGLWDKLDQKTAVYRKRKIIWKGEGCCTISKQEFSKKKLNINQLNSIRLLLFSVVTDTRLAVPFLLVTTLRISFSPCYYQANSPTGIVVRYKVLLYSGQQFH